MQAESIQHADGQEPAYKADLLGVEAQKKNEEPQPSSPSLPKIAKDRIKQAERAQKLAEKEQKLQKLREKTVPKAQCFKCHKQVDIASPELAKCKPGNNHKEGTRYKGLCSLCGTKVGVFVNSELSTNPKPKKELTPEQLEKKKQRAQKKRAARKLIKEALQRKELGLKDSDPLPKKKKKVDSLKQAVKKRKAEEKESEASRKLKRSTSGTLRRSGTPKVARKEQKEE